MENKITVGVIGAGVMGQGVAHQLSKFGYNVQLIDIKQDLLEKAKDNIRNICRLDILMQRQGKSPESINENILDNISFTTDINTLSTVGMVIENVPEKVELKLEVYHQIKDIIQDDCIVAVNTSATSITQISSIMRKPENVLGIHFVNPVHLMPTIEMIKGYFTSEECIQFANDFLSSMKMTGVLVNDSPGFVSNRVMLTYINEAIYCIQEDVGTPDAIDKIFRECLSHKMGPLQTADLIGLDTVLYSLEVLCKDFNDSKYRPAFLLKKMVNANLLGRKNGHGFYNYN